VLRSHGHRRLYGKEKILDAIPPWMGGGEMIRSVSLEGSTWNDLPWKFERARRTLRGRGSQRGDRLHSYPRLSSIGKREGELAAYARERLSGVRALTQYGAAPRRSGVFPFNLGDIHAHDVAQFLDREGIAVRAGHHCAQPLRGSSACRRPSAPASPSTTPSPRSTAWWTPLMGR